MQVLRTFAAEDIEYWHDETSFRLQADVEGIVPYLKAGPDGRLMPPDESNYDDFLALVIYPDDAAALLTAIESGSMGVAARFHMATTAWRNSQHMSINSLASQTGAIQAAIAKLTEAADTEADDAAPFGDSAATGPQTPEDGDTES